MLKKSLICLGLSLVLAAAAAAQGFTVNSDGSVTANGRIKSVTDPTANQDAATKNYVNNVAPSGVTAEDLPATPGAFVSSYRKFADGVMEVWGWGYIQWDGANTTVYKDFTFPVAFMDRYFSTTITYGISNTGAVPTTPYTVNDASPFWFGIHSLSTSGIRVFAFSPSGTPAVGRYSLFYYNCMGRWK